MELLPTGWPCRKPMQTCAHEKGAQGKQCSTYSLPGLTHGSLQWVQSLHMPAVKRKAQWAVRIKVHVACPDGRTCSAHTALLSKGQEGALRKEKAGILKTKKLTELACRSDWVPCLIPTNPCTLCGTSMSVQCYFLHKQLWKKTYRECHK